MRAALKAATAGPRSALNVWRNQFIARLALRIVSSVRTAVWLASAPESSFATTERFA